MEFKHQLRLDRDTVVGNIMDKRATKAHICACYYKCEEAYAWNNEN